MRTSNLPAGYHLEWEPDVLILRRLDGSEVAAFSAEGATAEAIRETAEEDSYGEPSDGHNAPAGVGIHARHPLWIRFFGPFELYRGGEVVPLPQSGKPLAILKYLLAHRSSPVSQDFLMCWLWPESGLKRARWSLNSATRTVRRFLCGGVSSATSPGYVVFTGGYYRLSHAVQISSDVDEFEIRYEHGRRLKHTRRMPEAVAEYEKAVELYRDDYLIEDLYEDWTMIERERLANTYVDVLCRLAGYYTDTRQYQRSVQTCYRMLKKDHCREDGYRLLMRCYDRMGLRGQALRQYRLCEKALRQTHGLAPSAQTRALFNSIRGSGGV